MILILKNKIIDFFIQKVLNIYLKINNNKIQKFLIIFQFVNKFLKFF